MGNIAVKNKVQAASGIFNNIIKHCVKGVEIRVFFYVLRGYFSSIFDSIFMEEEQGFIYTIDGNYRFSYSYDYESL